MHYELLEPLYAKCYMHCRANVGSSLAFVKAQTVVLRFNISARYEVWRKELFCIPSSPRWRPASYKRGGWWWGGGWSSTLSMGRLAAWLWCSASKNRPRALFLILSQSLCFSQNYWCMSSLEKQRGNIKSAFEVWGGFFFFFFFFLFCCQTTTKRFYQNPD